MFCIASLLLATVLVRDLGIPAFLNTEYYRHVLLNCQPSSLKAKQAVFLVVGILLSLVALAFAVMLYGGGWRKMFSASRISL